MSETVLTLLLSAGVFVIAYAALPFIVKPKFQTLMVNGTNSLFKIHIDHDAPLPLAIVAHELAEWEYKYRRPWLWFKFRTDSGRREVNLWGPAVETVVANQHYAVNIDQYARKEARTLKRAKPEFSGWTTQKIENEIRQRIPESRKWVADNLEKIKT